MILDNDSIMKKIKYMARKELWDGSKQGVFGDSKGTYVIATREEAEV